MARTRAPNDGAAAPPSTSDAFSAVRERFADAIGRIAGLYGVNPLLGRLYAVLLLAPEVMSLDEVTEAAGSAKSTASVALRNLEKYRLVRRQWRKSDRRTYYEARVDFAAMLGEWHELFLARDLDQVRAVCQEAGEGLAATAAARSGTDMAGARELMRRLESVTAWLSRLPEGLVTPPTASAADDAPSGDGSTPVPGATVVEALGKASTARSDALLGPATRVPLEVAQ